MARKSATSWNHLIYNSLSPTRILLLVSVIMNIIMAAMLSALRG